MPNESNYQVYISQVLFSQYLSFFRLVQLRKESFVFNARLIILVLILKTFSGGSATSLDANGTPGNYGGASGGSIWITCSTAKVTGLKYNRIFQFFFIQSKMILQTLFNQSARFKGRLGLSWV